MYLSSRCRELKRKFQNPRIEGDYPTGFTVLLVSLSSPPSFMAAVFGYVNLSTYCLKLVVKINH